MFTGIVEGISKVLKVKQEEQNLHITFENVFDELVKIDQSIAHNGICLTVVKILKKSYIVTVIKETIDKTNIGHLKIGDEVNVERSMKLGDRLDGHIVQGHIDQTAKCTDIVEHQGSWQFTFTYKPQGHITIEKGSITVNGTSLTVINSKKNSFSVAIIPYTFEHTIFKNIEVGSIVNLEFDVVGKYILQNCRN